MHGAPKSSQLLLLVQREQSGVSRLNSADRIVTDTFQTLQYVARGSITGGNDERSQKCC